MTNISLRLHGRYLRFGTLSHAAVLLFKPWGGFTLTFLFAIVTENQTTITHIPPYKIFCSSCSDEKNTLIYSLFLAARIDCLSFRDAHQIPLDILRNVCLVPLGRMTPDNQLIALRLRLLVHHDILFGCEFLYNTCYPRRS